MRPAAAFALAAALCLTPALAANAGAYDSTLFGVWATQKNDGRVRIEPCGGAVCARILDGDQLRADPDQNDVHNPDPSLRSRRVKGLLILKGYRGGPREWTGGSVYDPQTGDGSDDSDLTLNGPDTLVVRGCHWLLCRSEVWTRLRQTATQSSR